MSQQKHNKITPQPKTTSDKMKKSAVEFPFIQYSHKIDFLNRLLLLKEWKKQQNVQTYLPTRMELYDYIHGLIGNIPISFLEFGVYKGESIEYWTELNTNAESEFFGFDSFEGLPEGWQYLTGELGKGYFSTDGQLPLIDDRRVTFIKGWYQETLPSFLANFSTNKQLVIHNDSDLYSSTLYTLCSLDRIIQPGVIIIFDEFSSPLHEFRALEDYTTSFLREYDVLAAAGPYYDQIVIQITN